MFCKAVFYRNLNEKSKNQVIVNYDFDSISHYDYFEGVWKGESIGTDFENSEKK